MRRHGTIAGHCGRMRHLHFGHIHQLDIEDEIGLGGNAWVVRTVGHGARTIGHLPGNEDAALATDFHAIETVVEAGDNSAYAYRNRHGHGIGHLGLSIGTELGLAVGASDKLPVIVPGVEFDAVGRAPAGVLDVPDLACFTLCTLPTVMSS